MKKFGGLLVLLALSPLAQAHTGHLHGSFMDGVVHPFGFDHLLAMLAVGLWASKSLTGMRQWLAPLAFVMSLLAGAVFSHLTGAAFSWTEGLIAGSVIAFAGLLVVPKVLQALGFALIVSAGVAHGFAHGLEATQGGVFALYATGFMLTTVALHVVGLLAGQRLLTQNWQWQSVGAMMAGYGVYALGMMAG